MNNGSTVQAIAVNPAGAVTLQLAYNNGTTPPQILINGTPDPLRVHASVVGEIFQVRDTIGQNLLRISTSGGSIAGGSNAGNVLELEGALAGSADTGIVRVNSPIDLAYNTFDNTTPAQQFAMRWAPSVAATSNYVGGALQTAANFTVTTGVFIPAIFADGNIYNIAANPGFSAITFINELSIVQNSGNFNLPAALVQNIGLTHQRITAGTSSTVGTTGMNFGPLTKATASGAVMTKTDQTGLIIRPTWSTVAGSTANLGTIYGVRVDSPAVGIFQPNAGAETCTAIYGLYMNNPSGINNGFGTMPVATVRSGVSAGTNRYFLLQAGSAPSDFGGSHIFFDDNFGVAMGGIGVTNFDYWMSWNGAGSYLRQYFQSSASSMRWSSPANNRFLFDSDGGNTSGEYNFNCFKFSLGAQVGANGNSIGQFVAPSRATTVNGGWVDYSYSQAGNLTIDHNMSDVAALNMAAISLTIGTGAITGYITGLSIGMTTSGVTGVETSAIRPNGRIHHRGVMELPPLEPAQITANVNNYSPATFNSMRQVWRVTSDAARNITGILVPTSNNTADTQWIVNAGAFNITLTHQDAASTAGNRFISPTGVNYILGPDESACLWHDPASDRWRILWGTGA